ncbi:MULTISPECIES: TadE family protein [Clostridium]|uniref:TadE family protein n=1 Tax=Clostridium TaxID=1485 RepID=UPI00242C3CCF|nr:pilus assembly protein [Clostridium tyrobutyricum]
MQNKLSCKQIRLNKKGISATIESAGMFLVIALMIALVMQVSMWSLTQITVKAAAYEAARGGAKVGRDDAEMRANEIGHQYAQGILGFWNPDVNARPEGKDIKVTITQKVPVISKLFPQTTVTGVSKEIIEEEA